MHPDLEAAYSIEGFRESAHRVVDQLADHLERSMRGGHEQSLPWMEPEASVAHWAQIAEQGTTIEMLCEQLLARSVRISDPKYMGHQICLPAPVAMIAGLVTDVLNNGSGVYEMGMAGTAMEKRVIRSVAERIGWPETADGFLTSGGTLANLTALLAARAARSGNSDWQQGTHEQLAVLVSDQAHYCVERAARIMGWGDAGIIRVPSDDSYRMQTSELPRLLRAALQAGTRVIAVVGSACSTSTGSFDDLTEIAKFCADHELWFHVDAAHGGALAFSDLHRPLLDGIQQADSVAIDFHKMLMTPVLCSGLLFRRAEDGYRTFATDAEYLFARSAVGEPQQFDEFNLARRTFECTKTMMAAKIFSVLAIHGPQLLGLHVDHLHALAAEFAGMIEARAGFELAAQPQTNIVCFRYVPAGMRADEVGELMTRTRERIIKNGKHYIVKTELRGDVWLRATLANAFTTADHMNALLDVVAQTASELVAGQAENV